MGFFGKKRSKQESNLSLPDISSSKNIGDEIKFPEFPSYESTAELDTMKAREQEYRSSLNKPIIPDIPKRKMADNLVVQDKPRFQNFQAKENMNFVPLRQKQYKPQDDFTQEVEPTQNFDQNTFENPQPEIRPRYETDVQETYQQPILKSQETITPTYNNSSDKPVFIKLENYKDVLLSLESIRKKIRDAESMLENLHKLKSEEERALENWKTQIESLKNKLLDIDKKLFE